MDWLSIILASVVTYLIGWLWYSDKLFGTTWKQGHNLSESSMQSGNPISIYGQSFVMTLVFCFILATLMNMTENHSCMADGLKFGFMVGLGLITMAFGIQYSFMRKPFKLILIDGGYYILMAAVAGAIIGSFSL